MVEGHKWPRKSKRPFTLSKRPFTPTNTAVFRRNTAVYTGEHGSFQEEHGRSEATLEPAYCHWKNTAVSRRTRPFTRGTRPFGKTTRPFNSSSKTRICCHAKHGRLQLYTAVYFANTAVQGQAKTVRTKNAIPVPSELRLRRFNSSRKALSKGYPWDKSKSRNGYRIKIQHQNKGNIGYDVDRQRSQIKPNTRECVVEPQTTPYRPVSAPNPHVHG